MSADMANHHQIQFFTFNTEAKIPYLGLGTANISPAADTIITAVKFGYRHFDYAHNYDNEKEIGVSLKKLFKDGVVKREELNTDHVPEDVPAALDRTLQDLQLKYVDLYLIHWPVSMRKGSIGHNPEDLTQPDIPSTWRAMEVLYDSGKARAIGVSNFSIKKLQDLLALARVPPAVNEVECHLMWRQPKLCAFCQSKGLHLSIRLFSFGWGPFTK